MSLATTERVRQGGMAAAITRCREVNRLLGTSLGPWDLMDLPEEWLTALEMWVDDLPKVRAWQAESQAALARVRHKVQ